MPNIQLHRRRINRNTWKVFLTENGEEASRLWVHLKTLRIGSVNVRIGGIGGVGTQPEHRLKGYASLVMDESTVLMQDLNLDIGFLFGIRDFYHRFGYAVAFSSPTLQVKIEDLCRAKSIVPTRVMKKADGPRVARLYNHLNTQLTATVVRPQTWSYFEYAPVFQKPGRAILTLGNRGQISGYTVFDTQDDRFLVSEIGGNNHTTFETLATLLGRRARQAGVDTVTFHLPETHAFVAHCARYGCRLAIEHHRNAGPMARIIHLKPLLEKLVPEFNRRLGMQVHPLQTSLTLKTDIGSLGLKLQDSSVVITPGRSKKVVELPQRLLTQLVFGYRSVADILHDPDAGISPGAQPALTALFPKQPAYMWWSDRF
ncbi:MAG: GNAT family N-acetyltransferase [bacterium]|nr:GNAT family N-acetyltransferase [bacterium]